MQVAELLRCNLVVGDDSSTFGRMHACVSVMDTPWYRAALVMAVHRGDLAGRLWLIASHWLWRVLVGAEVVCHKGDMCPPWAVLLATWCVRAMLPLSLLSMLHHGVG